VYPYCHREHIEDTIVVVLGQKPGQVTDNKIVVEYLDVSDEGGDRLLAERLLAEFAYDTYIIKIHMYNKNLTIYTLEDLKPHLSV
jgi:hypothetical protein